MHRSPSTVIVAVAVSVVAFAACSSGPADGPATERVVALFGGADAAAVLADRSDAVVREAFRIESDGPRPGRDPDAPGTVRGYPILAGPVPVDAATAAELSRLLLDDATYLWETGKLCAFQPGVAVRERRGATVVELLFCFSCDQVEIVVNGNRSGLEDTDPRRQELLRIARGLFPADAALRALR